MGGVQTWGTSGALISLRDFQSVVQTCEDIKWKNTIFKNHTTRLAQVFLQVLVLIFYTEGLYNLDEDNFGSMGLQVQTRCVYLKSDIPIIPNRSGFENGHEGLYHDSLTLFQLMLYYILLIIETAQHFASLPTQSQW